MGSKDQRQSRVDIFHQAYVGPLEAVPWASTFLKEQDRSLVALRKQPAKMATQSHTVSLSLPFKKCWVATFHILYVYFNDQYLSKERSCDRFAKQILTTLQVKHIISNVFIFYLFHAERKV